MQSDAITPTSRTKVELEMARTPGRRRQGKGTKCPPRFNDLDPSSRAR